MIIDIVIFVFFITACVICYRIGFMKCFIKLANAVFGLFFAIMFCTSFANVLTTFGLQDDLYDVVHENIVTSDAYLGFIEDTTTAEQFITELGVPSFISHIVIRTLGENDTLEVVTHNVSQTISTCAVYVIAFLILWIGVSLAFVLMKLFANSIRKIEVARIVDGIIGIIWGAILYSMGCVIFFFIVNASLELNSVNQLIGPFIDHQTNQGFICEHLIDNNLLTNIFKLFI